MFFLSKFLPNLQWNSIKKLEDDADDVLELPQGMKAIRKDGEVTIVDYKKHKVIQKLKDTYPNTPARAAFEISKELNLFEEEPKEEKQASKEIWTCNFRDGEQRWVWYRNLEPKITVAFTDTKKDENEKQYFNSAKFGTDIINQIKETSLEKTASSHNALILEYPYISIKCMSCNAEEKYTIDDLVDQNKKANYNGKYIVCANCGNLAQLS